jgi:hypothetical protein
MSLSLMRDKGRLLSSTEMDDNLSELYNNRVTLNTVQTIDGIKTFYKAHGVNFDLNGNDIKRAITTFMVNNSNSNENIFVSFESPLNPDYSKYELWIKIKSNREISDSYVRDENNNWKYVPS